MNEIVLGVGLYLLFSVVVALMVARFISVGNPPMDYEDDSREQE